MKNKINFYWRVILLMVLYIGIVYYFSKPNLIDNSTTYKNNDSIQLNKYDFIVIPFHENLLDIENNVKTGMVLQIGSSHALVKIYEGGFSWENYNDVEINNNNNNYRIIGKGTIYHIINYYFGFNVMKFTQFIAFIVVFLYILKIILKY